MITPQYTPEVGHQVRVRRYEVPCPELPGLAERKMLLEVIGTVATVRPKVTGVLFTLEGDETPIFTGSQFTGQDPDHGCSWTLQTEVVPLAGVAAHDQAALDARVALAEREKAAALALWERARDAEVIARQRLTGAQERLEAAMRTAHAAQPAVLSMDDMSERRRADRAVMAGQVAQLARPYGLSAYVTLDEAVRRAEVDLTGPHGLQVTVRFDGNSAQAEPDTYVLSWHGVEAPWRLAPERFGSVNLHHGHKATDVARGFESLYYLLAVRFATIADGSAFVQLPG